MQAGPPIAGTLPLEGTSPRTWLCEHGIRMVAAVVWKRFDLRFGALIIRDNFRQEASITWCDLFQPKFSKKCQNYHITWRPWTFKTSTFGVTWCDNFWPNLLIEVAESFHIRWRMLAAQHFCTWHFVPPKPEFGAKFWKRILDTQILDPNSWGSNFWSCFSSKRGPLKNSPSRNSPLKVHLPKFNPEIWKRYHCPHKHYQPKKKFWGNYFR